MNDFHGRHRQYKVIGGQADINKLVLRNSKFKYDDLIFTNKVE